MARIWLHIGHGKTGTTAIQWAMDQRVRHFGDMIYPVQGRQQGQKGHHALFPLKGDAYGPAILEELQGLAAQIADAEKPVVISSEHLCHATETKARQITGILAGHDLTVVYYVRRQDVLMESSFRQRQWNHPGTCQDPAEFIERFARGFDFEERIRRWAAVLGDHSISARLYHPEIIGNDVVGDFERFIGLPDWPDRPVEKKNISMTAAGTRRIMAAAVRKGPERARALARKIQGTAVEGDDSPFLDETARRAIMERYRASNERFAKRFLDERSAALLLAAS